MMDINVILVRPKFSGNIGAVARVMSNFGFKNLILVNPTEIDQEARNRAKHANDILSKAEVLDEIETALDRSLINIGTTGIVNTRQTGHVRNPLTPDQLFEKIGDITDNSLGLVFGREDTGLLDDELKHLDMLLSIPTCREYPVMNLSHAVALVLWEFYRRNKIPKKFIPGLKDTTGVEREKLIETFIELMELINYPPQRREKTAVLWRRMMGRSVPTNWEYHTIMGVLAGTVRKIKRDSGDLE